MILNFFSNNEDKLRLSALKKMSLFVKLSDREMRSVDGFMHERNYLKDEIVFDEGEEGQALYVILEGKVMICHQGQTGQPIAVLGAGDFCGELALLDDGPRVAQARAAENCLIMVLFRRDFQSLMDSHQLIGSKITLQLARHIGTRLRAAMSSDLGPL